MVYHLALAGLTFAGLVLRSVFPRVLRLAWTSPDFLLLLVVFNAMFSGHLRGGAAGFFIGLTQDLFFGRFIGLNALAKCVVGVAAGSQSRSVFRENVWVAAILVFLSSLLSQSIVFVFGLMAGARWYIHSIAYQVLFETLCNVCLVPVVYGPFFAFAGRRLRQSETEAKEPANPRALDGDDEDER